MKTIFNKLTNFWYLIRFYFLVWFTNYFEREPVSKPYKEGYHVTFEDNFDKPIDWENKWNKYYSTHTETSADKILHSIEQIKVEDGNVLLSTDKSDISLEFPFEAGYLCSKGVFSQELGIFQYRFKAAPGGLTFFDAGWAYDEGLEGNKCNDNQPPLEIDAFECMHKGDIGGETTSISFHHHFHKLSNGKTMKGRKLRCLKLSKYFHIVSFDWQEDKITWRLNGIPVFRVVNNIPRVKMCVVINSAGHKDYWPIESELPGIVRFSDVRVFQKNKNK